MNSGSYEYEQAMRENDEKKPDHKYKVRCIDQSQRMTEDDIEKTNNRLMEKIHGKNPNIRI